MLVNRCPVCGQSVGKKGSLCAECRSILDSEHFRPGVCPQCGMPVAGEAYACRFCADFPGREVRIIHPYSGLSRDILYSYKFKCKKELASVLADEFTNLINGTGIENPVIVPIPSSPASIRKRGFDQMLLVAKKMPFEICPCLQRNDVREQKRMGMDERLGALRNKFSLCCDANDFDGKTAFVIDDVGTTFSSMVSALDILSVAGIKAIGIVYCAQPYLKIRKE